MRAPKAVQRLRHRLWGRRTIPAWVLTAFWILGLVNNAIGLWTNIDFVADQNWSALADVVGLWWPWMALFVAILWFALAPETHEREHDRRLLAASPTTAVHRGILWESNAPNEPKARCKEHGVALLYRRGSSVQQLHRHDMIGPNWGEFYCPKDGGHSAGDLKSAESYETLETEAKALLDAIPPRSS